MSPAVSGCCDESGCRRKTPILLRRNRRSGRWCFITRYTIDGEGNMVTAQEKHWVGADLQDALDACVSKQGWKP